MGRIIVMLALIATCVVTAVAHAQSRSSEWRMVYTPSHRVTYQKEWKYSFPNQQSTHWVIALRYPPELGWSKDAVGKAELLTSDGWKPFQEVTEGSAEKRRMLIMDYPHTDPQLANGFTIRTSLTATVCNQQLVQGRPAKAVSIDSEDQNIFTSATPTFDFDQPDVKKWMNSNSMWKRKNEKTLAFAQRVYQLLRRKLPYNTADGGKWICSQILRTGYGECCRHAIVGTSILRANGIPARTVCGLWAINEQSKGAHCWGEFFLEGTGWVPYDTTIDDKNKNTELYFGRKKGEVLAGMVDFDWVIDAGPYGEQTVFGIDYLPAFWSVGQGNLNSPRLETNERVTVVKRFR